MSINIKMESFITPMSKRIKIEDFPGYLEK